ncbi:MAG: hypothetical protein HY698_03780 [Deltaproteobacteria bacterium]|nr:hypothetical protein [Deltaproteobacteria bacterium]
MKLELFTEILSRHLDARKEGSCYLVSGDTELTLFVALEGETLPISRVTRVEVLDSLLVLDTVKGERYVVSRDEIRAVKMDRADTSRRDRGAGFGK